VFVAGGNRDCTNRSSVTDIELKMSVSSLFCCFVFTNMVLKNHIYCSVKTEGSLDLYLHFKFFMIFCGNQSVYNLPQGDLSTG